MRLSPPSLVLALALTLSACQSQPPATAPTKSGLPWASFMASGVHDVKGHVTTPDGMQSAKVYLAQADGSPIAGLFASVLDAQGAYSLSGAPGDRTVLVVAEITMPTGERILLKSMARTDAALVNADINQATTIAAEWALQSANGTLGGFDANAFGQIVTKSYTLLSAGPSLNIRNINDIVKALNNLAKDDVDLKAAMGTLQDRLAKVELDMAAAQAAIDDLQDRINQHKKRLEDLEDQQGKALGRIKNLEDTTKGLHDQIQDDLKPKLDELRNQHEALGHDLDDLKALTGQEIADLVSKAGGLQKDLDDHKKFTQDQLDDLKTGLGNVGSHIDDLEGKTNQKLKDLEDALTNGMSELKGMVGDLQSALHAQDDTHKTNEADLQNQIAALNSAMGQLNGHVGDLKKQLDDVQVDVNNVKDLKGAVDALNGKVTGQGDSVTALIDRVNNLQSRDHKTSIVSFDNASTTSKNTYANLTGASLTFDAPADGRLMVMYQGTSKNSNNGRNNQLRVAVDANTDGEQVFGPTTADNLVGMGTMAVFTVTKGAHTIQLQGTSTNNNGSNPNAASTTTFSGKLFAMMLDDTSDPIPTPSP